MRNGGWLLIVGLVGSGCGNAWEGTWLLRFDPNAADQTADCGDPSSGEVFGTEDVFVDVAFTTEKTCVIQTPDGTLTGQEDGGQIVVSRVEGYSYGDELQRTTTTLTMTRDGGTMSGTMVSLDEEETTSYNGPETYSCQRTIPFTGEQLATEADVFVTPSTSGN